jgi:hypothetical protein
MSFFRFRRGLRAFKRKGPAFWPGLFCLGVGLAVLVLRPACPIHALTGLLCPGCGGTRAVLALLHGDLIGAWRENALLVVLLPGLLGYGGICLRRRAFVRVPGPWLAAVYGAVAVFTVYRNVAS